MNGYKVEIRECSRELTAKERIIMKDTSNAIKLDEACAEGEKVTFIPTAYAILGIHNEKSENKDYEVFLIETADGNKYVTGSESFFSTFQDIWDEMEGDDSEWGIEAYKLESKNYKGKYFLTCSIC